MSLDAGRVGVRADQVDVHGRVTSPSFLNELLEDLPEWTDMPVWVNGTEELLPSNNSVPVTSPILTDIAYPDIRRDNQYFTYRESPTPVDGLAKIKSIKGNTLVWNQLVEPKKQNAALNGITLTNNGDGSFTLNGTATANTDFRIDQTVSADNLKSYSAGTYILLNDLPDGVWLRIMQNTTWVNVANFKSNERIVTLQNNIDNCFIFFYILQGTTLNNVKIYPQITNITKLGSSAITDLASFKSFYNLPYYDFNQGSLLSFNGNGIKTTGKNLLDSSQLQQGSLKSENGSVFESTTRVYTPFIKAFENTFTVSTSANLQTMLFVYDSSGNYIPSERDENWRNLPYTYTINDDRQIRLIFRYSTNATILPNNVTEPMICFGNSTDYEPYTTSTTSLPISTYFPAGMKSAGNAYDELTPTKAITRIGVVDLGSLAWNQLSARNDGFFTNAINPTAKTATTNLKLIGYTVDNSIALDMADMTMKIDQSDGSYLYLINSAYTSNPNGLKASLNGVYLYYELATPVELPTLSLGE